ncbi:hypothetical protein BCR32DRAFT_290958 [Anaeromyces robustus]|uniref:Uncharacterized protein n=1 Tax=Anaeromyces robustus TaxID=1754192 RepID=A0A1Y1XGX0_9FUNG|nr:hypothetical protein BCR32DRAFT_290958 [Anaeromyces robustus]|eukprot:ORX85001.1 hypothetical protein BCR32DRAFT_290958 [Anaeromyces robustus]
MIKIQHENVITDSTSQTKPDDYLKQSSDLYASNPPTIIPLVGISPESEIIYEVNLSVPKEKATEYVNWLMQFTKNQCQTTPGFTLCNVFSQPKPAGLHWLSEEGNSKCYFTIQYHIRSHEYLKDYLKYEQAKVSVIEIDRFQYNIISRRVLRNLFSTSS